MTRPPLPRPKPRSVKERIRASVLAALLRVEEAAREEHDIYCFNRKQYSVAKRRWINCPCCVALAALDAARAEAGEKGEAGNV